MSASGEVRAEEPGAGADLRLEEREVAVVAGERRGQRGLVAAGGRGADPGPEDRAGEVHPERQAAPLGPHVDLRARRRVPGPEGVAAVAARRGSAGWRSSPRR